MAKIQLFFVQKVLNKCQKSFLIKQTGIIKKTINNNKYLIF